MNMPQSDSMTLPQLKDLGEFLIPVVREAIRPEFSRLREELHAAISAANTTSEDRVKRLESELDAAKAELAALKKEFDAVKQKAVGVSTGVSLTVAVIGWLLSHLGGK